MTEKLRLEISLLLPDIVDERDGCVVRLQEALSARPGVDEAHVVRENGSALLCLHYNPTLVSLVEVRGAAEQAGAWTGWCVPVSTMPPAGYGSSTTLPLSGVEPSFDVSSI